MMIMKMLMMVAKSKTVKMMMVTGVWEDNDPSLSVRCKAEGRPRALPRVEVAQVGNMMMMILVMLMMMTSVVKADFLKAVRKAVSKRLIRLLYKVFFFTGTPLKRLSVSQ